MSVRTDNRRTLTTHTTLAAGLTLSVLASVLAAATGLLWAEEVTVAAAKAAAEDCVRGACLEQGEVVLEWEEFPALDGLEGQDLEIRPRLMRRPDARGPLPISIEFWRDGERVDRRAASARVGVYRDVLVATRRLDRNTAVEQDAVSVERRDVRTLGHRGLASLEEAIGKRTRRLVPEGEILTAADLEEVPLIERGDRVLVTVHLGGITVSATAVALEDGFEGQVIDVKNDRSGKRFQGTVVAGGLVRVDLAGVL